MATALITGATAGIGNAFANLLAAQGFDLVLVARDEPRLHAIAEELHARYQVRVEPFRADLSRYDECAWVEQRLADPSRPIDVLVNNAGFAVHRNFATGSLLEEQAMFDVLCRAVMRLSHAAVRGMEVRGQGAILNVSSVAGWVPRSTYGAAKSYVTAFSRALRGEVKRRGVNVIAVCPGYTRTEFHERASMSTSRIPGFLWLDSNRVAAAAWHDVNRGKALSVPGAFYRVARFLLRFAY